jgi:sigma-54 specific flagellar transcriptional regulator A
MPALRERPEDIPMLVTYFLQLLNRKYRRDVRRLTPEALELLADYAWPGNVRELRNVLERVYVETAADVIGHKAFAEWSHERSQFFPGAWNVAARQAALAARPVLVTPYPGTSRVLPRLPAPETLPAIDMAPTSFAYLDSSAPGTWEARHVTPPRKPEELTRQCLEQAFRQAAGNITETARLLGMHRATLYRRLKALGMTRENLEASLEPPPQVSAVGNVPEH